jgi:glycosyltransferase involved in cell wall biosynthesis
MKISIVAAGFTARHARLQPWRYLGEVATGLAGRGHEVAVYTDARAEHAISLVGVSVVASWPVPRALSRGRRPPATPGEDQLVLWHVGRLAPLGPPPRRGGERDIAILTAPLYTPGELAGILRASWRHASIAAIHVAGAAIPIRVLARHLASHYGMVVTLARYASERLAAGGLPPHCVRAVPPGVDPVAVDVLVANPQERSIVFAYAGNASPARGPDVLVRAFAAAFRHEPDVRLRMAVRHEDEALYGEEERLAVVINQAALGDRIEVSGDLPREEILALFRDSTAVVLPFRVVPSEAPLMPLEVASVGGVVVTTDLPPLREVAPPGTVFVRPGSVAALEGELRRIAGSAGPTPSPVRPTRGWESVVDEVEGVLVRTAVPQGRTIERTAPRARVVYLCGNDGTGKTTQARLLVAALEVRGIPARYVWLRFPQLFSIPVLALSRALGVTRYETVSGKRTGRWEFHRARWLALVLLWTQVVDARHDGHPRSIRP